jgi:hypothetical protein
VSNAKKRRERKFMMTMLIVREYNGTWMVFCRHECNKISNTTTTRNATRDKGTVTAEGKA